MGTSGTVTVATIVAGSTLVLAGNGVGTDGKGECRNNDSSEAESHILECSEPSTSTSGVLEDIRSIKKSWTLKVALGVKEKLDVCDMSR